MPTPVKDLYVVSEVADILGVPRTQVSMMCRIGLANCQIIPSAGSRPVCYTINLKEVLHLVDKRLEFFNIMIDKTKSEQRLLNARKKIKQIRAERVAQYGEELAAKFD